MRSALVGIAGIALAALAMWAMQPLPWGVAAYGRFAATWEARLAPGIVPESAVPAGGPGPDIYCTYLGEGVSGTVAVTKWTSGTRNFHSAGKVQASNEPRDMRLQRMLGHLSALLHRRPESVLVVACGAGVTAGTFVTYPEVQRIVICDIEPLVPQSVAPLFERENHGVLRDPRTQVVFADGRHFVRNTAEKFDVITSDPIDPWVKGCAALNTTDYYAYCKAHLKPGGVMSLWLPFYESDPQSTASLIATFFQIFPHGLLWTNDSDGESYDAVLLGQAEPSHIDPDAWQARLDRADYARVKQSLADVGFRTALDLLATYGGRAAELQPWTRTAVINTDRNLRLQYLAGWGLNAYEGETILGEIHQHYRFPEDLFLGVGPRHTILRNRLNARAGKLAPGAPARDE